MLFSHVHVSHAANNGKAADAPAAQATQSQTDGSKELELEDLDPASLHVKKLGEEDPNEEEVGELTPITEDLEKTVRVTIFLKAPSAVDAGYTTENIGTNADAAAYRNSLKAQQNALARKIEAALGHSIEVRWHLTLLTNAISTTVKVKEIPFIKRLDGVSSVVQEAYFEAPVTEEGDQPNTATTSSGMTGATTVWAAGYTGAGMRIAIIDTGLDTTHQSFAADAFEYSLDQDGYEGTLLTERDLSTLSSQLQGNGSYISSKIPYGYNYRDKNTDVTHMNDTQEEHGSHVAGIAAANRYIKSGDSFVDAAENVFAVGQAPDAQLIIMKVFGKGGGAYDSDYMVAIEDAITLGANTINLSLGSAAPGTTYSEEYQGVMNKLADKDINPKTIVSISAGNSGAFSDELPNGIPYPYAEDPNMDTVGSPGSFINSLCVASIDNIATVASPIVFDGSISTNYMESASQNGAPVSSIQGDSNYVYIDALGEAEDYATVNAEISLAGKIVIINRGAINFSAKGNNLIPFSPKALIVANNAAGGVFGMSIGDYTGTFTMLSISQEAALQIKASATKTTVGNYNVYTGSVNIATDPQIFETGTLEEATVSSFSSWGVPGSLILKPEIAAPGGNIWSVNGTHISADDGTSVVGSSSAYESMSGTSMAAPHIAGLAALVAQYLETFDIEAANKSLVKNYSERAIAQSLLMSTAVPMLDAYYESYYPVLRQGAGRAEVSLAMSSPSVIMMGKDDDTLTAKTGAAADGKVKAEFGDDPDRTGIYKYSFTAYNLTDYPLAFDTTTDLMIQYPYNGFGDGFTHMTDMALAMTEEDGNYTVSYVWDDLTNAHDVDQDGDTDADDVQAILDYIVSNRDLTADGIEAGDMDGDEELTSWDAHLLLLWLDTDPGEIPPHGERSCTVTITLGDLSGLINYYYENGIFVQGYTYLSCDTATDEGMSLAHEHSIPLLAYYGSWTEPSMFDAQSYADYYYASTNGEDFKLPYSGSLTNYLTVYYGGQEYVFLGNPYTVEEEFPYDRLAVNSKSTIGKLTYTLIRTPGTSGFAVSLVDDYGGDVSEVLLASLSKYDEEPLYYHINQGKWMNTTPVRLPISFTPASANLKEGDLFRIGYYAIPEYYGMLRADDITDTDAGHLSAADLKAIIGENVLGRGAWMGFDLKVDDTAPTITKAMLDGTTLTVSASDNEALAYFAVMDLNGEIIYQEEAPGKASASMDVDIAAAIADANGYIAIFAADYAGNETAKAIKVNDNGVNEKIVYVLTNKLSINGEYLIVNVNEAGEGLVLAHTGSTVFAADVNVNEANDSVQAPYIAYAPESAVWKAANGFTLANGDKYLASVESGEGRALTAAASSEDWSWNESKSRLITTDLSGEKFYLTFGEEFGLDKEAGSIYLYRKTVIASATDPTEPASLTVTPDELKLMKGQKFDLQYEILPITAADTTVTWHSSDESIASVDENGRVYAVKEGEAVITAVSNGNPSLSADCIVTVETVTKDLRGIVYNEDSELFVSDFNTGTLPTFTPRHEEPLGEELHSATLVDSEYNIHLGATFTGRASELYLFVESNYNNLIDIGANRFWTNDFAAAPADYAGGLYVYAYGNNLILGNIMSEDDGNGNKYCGWVYDIVSLNLGTDASGEASWIASIALKSRTATSAEYYLLADNGSIWTISWDLDNIQSDEDSGFGDAVKVMDTGIPCTYYYQNMYYSDGFIFWACFDSAATANGTQVMYLIDLSEKTVSEIGNFGDGVWPVTALYEPGIVSPEGVNAGAGKELSDKLHRKSTDEMDALEARINASPKAVLLKNYTETAPEEPEVPAAEPEVPAEEVTEAPVAEVPVEEVTEAPAVEDPAEEVTEAPVVEEPAEEVTEAPVVEEPAEEVTEAPAAEEPAEEEIPAEPEAAEEPAEEVTEAPAAEEPAEEEIPAEPEAAEEPAEEEAPEAAGGLTATKLVSKKDVISIKPSADLNAVVIDETDPEDETSESFVVEFKKVTNGKYTVEYDPTKLTLEKVEIAAEFKAWTDEDGVVTIAFAQAEPLEEIEDDLTLVATLVFSAYCFDEEITVTTIERNDELGLAEIESGDVEGIDHKWAEPTWVWTGNDEDGYTQAVASFICEREPEDLGHTTTRVANLEMGTLTCEVTFEPTLEAEGEKTWTATVELGGETYTDTKVVKIPKLEAYKIILTNYSEELIETSLVADKQYEPGEVTFTVTCDMACVVAVEGEDGSFTALPFTINNDGKHEFTVTIANANVKVSVALRGDANLNGAVDGRDMTAVNKHYLETKLLSGLALIVADANKDGEVDAKDVTRIQKLYLEMIESLEW